jgi:hypothetical protein
MRHNLRLDSLDEEVAAAIDDEDVCICAFRHDDGAS